MDGAALAVQQRYMKDNIATILADRQQMMQQITQTRELLERNSTDQRNVGYTSSSTLVEKAPNPGL